jgi:hypothetical protein
MKVSRIIIRTLKFSNFLALGMYCWWWKKKYTHNFYVETRHLEGQDMEAM